MHKMEAKCVINTLLWDELHFFAPYNYSFFIGQCSGKEVYVTTVSHFQTFAQSLHTLRKIAYSYVGLFKL